MADNVIKEFLVGLGFKVDPKSEKKFNEGLEFATAKAVALGEAMYDVAKQVTAAVVSMAQDMDQLYWKTQRLNSSAADIKSFGYAMSQLGGSTQGAQAMLENLAEFAKSSPGAQGFLRRLGVSPEDMGDAVAMARDLERTFQSMPYFRAKAFASVLGIDLIQLQAMLRDQGQFEDQYKQFAQNLGIDLDAVAGKANEFSTRLREMKAEAGLAFDVALYKGMEWLLPKLEALSRWVQDIVSGKKLSGVGGEFQKIVKDVMSLLDALGQLAATPYMQNFADKMLSALGHVIKGLTGLVKLVTDVLNGNWAAAWSDAKNVAYEASGALDNTADALVGYGSDRYRRNGTDPIGDPNNLTPDWMRGGANDNGGRGYVPGGQTADSNTPRSRRAEQLLMASGFSAPAAKGIAAALWAESGLNERRWNGEGSGAYGLAQWLTKSRVAEFARKFGHSIYQSTFAEQIQFVAHELRTTHSAVGDRIKRMRDAMQVAAVVIDQFEAPGPAGARGDLRRAGQYLGVSGAGRGGLAINQKTDIHVHGAGAHDVANDIAGHQDSVNQRLVSNASVYAF